MKLRRSRSARNFRVKNHLPKDIEKPVIAQFQQGDVPVFTLSAVSDKRTTEDIRKIVDQGLKENSKRVSGVANVEVAGGRERKILIEADQVKLAAYGCPLDEVTSVLGANDLNLLGEVKNETDRYLIRVIGEFNDLEKIRNMALRQTHGRLGAPREGRCRRQRFPILSPMNTSAERPSPSSRSIFKKKAVKTPSRSPKLCRSKWKK